MAGTNPAVHALDVEQRNRLERSLVEFERSWHANRLTECAANLPSAGAFRAAALVELVKIDLERCWQCGKRPTAEEYAVRFPELLAADGVPFEIIRAELEVRRRTGTADEESFCRRFPGHGDALRELLSRTVLSNPVPPAQAELGTSDGGPSTARSAPRGEPTGLPERFGRYLIRHRLGQGGMGAVFLAHDTELGRDVAVKVPLLVGDDASDTLERFYREARAAAALHHPHLCPVYDVGQIDGTHFLTMAYIEGRTLADDIKTGPRPPVEAAALARLLALALEFAHRHGVVHRDLKPANVLLTAAGEPAITDFGLARRVNQEAEPLTKAGAILGTPAYMSPEQVQGHNDAVGPSSDVYSLGVILYELLTGQRPFRGTMTSIMVQIATDEPELPSRFQQGLPPQLEEIVVRAMKKQIDARYPSMGAFAAALGDYLAADAAVTASKPQPATREQPKKPARRPLWVVAAAMVAATALLTTFVITRYRDTDGKEQDTKVETAPGGGVQIGTGQGVVVTPIPAGPAPPTAKSVPAPAKPEVEGDGKPLATAKHPKGLLVELLEVKADKSEKVVVRWRYTNKGKQPVELVGYDGPFAVPLRSSGTWLFYNDVHYQEGKAVSETAVRHDILKYSDGKYDATPVGKGVKIAAGETFEVWAKFSLPRNKVESITIHLPDIEPFESVPFRFLPGK